MDYLTVEEVSKELGISEYSIREMLRKHEMPGYKFGRDWRIDKGEYAEWKKQRRNQYRPSQES